MCTLYTLSCVACDETSPVARRSLPHSVTVAIARKRSKKKSKTRKETPSIVRAGIEQSSLEKTVIERNFSFTNHSLAVDINDQ